MPNTTTEARDSDSNFSHYEPCEVCGSNDNVARYDDGHGYCFGCGAYYHGDELRKEEEELMEGFIPRKPQALRSRSIRKETCSLAGYGVGEWKGVKVQVADYRDEAGELIAQKLKSADKQFVILGDSKKMQLWQQHRYKKGGRRLPIFEGETDCLQWLDKNPRYPAVAVPNGAAGAAKAIARNIEFVESFQEVIICFDADAPGQAAARECAALLTPGKARIMTLPGEANDVCDAVKQGLTKQLIESFWNAKVWRPDGIVAGDELFDVITNEDEVPSTPYPFEGLNEKLRGLRPGELVTVCAGTGVGKSQLCRNLAIHLMRSGAKVGYIALEESLARTGLSLLGQVMKKPLHLGRNGTTIEEMKEAFDAEMKDRLFVYNHFGSMSSENLLSRCRYLRIAEGCSYLIIDHLSILVSGWGDGDERRLIDNVMTALRSQVCEATGAGMILVSHLKRVDGRSAERGGEPELSHLRGSQAISQLSDACIALSRDTMGDDPNLTTVRVLKNRFSGDLGLACYLRFDPETGTHTEVNPEFESEETPF